MKKIEYFIINVWIFKTIKSITITKENKIYLTLDRQTNFFLHKEYLMVQTGIIVSVVFLGLK